MLRVNNHSGFAGRSVPVIGARTAEPYLTFNGSGYIALNSNIDFAGDWEVAIDFMATALDTNAIVLFAGDSNNRISLFPGTSQIIVNVNGVLTEQQRSATLATAINTRYELIVRRVASQLSCSLNGGAWVNIGSPISGTFRVNKVAAETTTRRFIGSIYRFRIGNDVYDLREGAGTNVVGTATTGTLQGTGTIWGSQASSLVINAGVSGDPTANIIARMDRVAGVARTCVLLVGTNDSLNSSTIVAVATFKSNLRTIVDYFQSRGIPVIMCMITPVVDSYLKSRHAYEPFYGAESGFDCNDIVLQFNTAIQDVAHEKGCQLAELNNRFQMNGDPKTTADSWLRNVANAGTDDGVHPTPAGYTQLASVIAPLIPTHGRVLCIGDSITFGVNSVGAGTATGETYPSRLREALNP